MPPRRAAQMCRPYGGCRSGYFFLVGPVPDRPAGIRTGRDGSIKPGAGLKPRCLKFSSHPGPSGVLVTLPPRAKSLAAISALSAAALRRLRSEMRLRARAGGETLRSLIEKSEKAHLCRIKKIYLKLRKKLTRMWEKSLTIGRESGIVDLTNKNNSC